MPLRFFSCYHNKLLPSLALGKVMIQPLSGDVAGDRSLEFSK
jgi:hypothetical protein